MCYDPAMKAQVRQDAILRALRRSGFLTVSALADAVGASRRTILRDIAQLREQGFLIQSDCGRGGGLQLDPSSAQTAAPLAVTEIFALILCVATMRSLRYLPFMDLADAGLAKIEKRLNADKVKNLRGLLDRLFVGRISPQQDISDIGAIDEALMPCVETAFLQRQPLSFAYRDASGTETHRLVEPQAMLILAPLWYLVAWDPFRNDFRHFRMDRIGRPVVVDGPAFRRRHVPFEADICPYAELAP
jgi:predicted DNA-binding transcriptional regulator YafY